MSEGYRWERYPNRDHAVHGGRDVDGCPIYVGRAYHAGDMLPAKVLLDKNVAYVSHGGAEHAKHDFEVLCKKEFRWEHTSGGDIPSNAVPGGHTCDGEPLYIGRAFHEGVQVVGKVQPSHGCLYIPFDGVEQNYHSYEILVYH